MTIDPIYLFIFMFLIVLTLSGGFDDEDDYFPF